MKLTIDTEKKTIEVNEEIVLGELIKTMEKMFPLEFHDWKLIIHTPKEAAPWTIPWTPTDPNTYPQSPFYNPQPGTTPITLWCTTTVTNNADVPFTETGSPK